MNYDKKIQKILEQFAMPLSVTRIGTDPEEVIKSPPYRLLMLLDPSGVLSIPDVVFSIQEANKNPTLANKIIAVLSFICIIPALAIAGKAIKTAIWGGKFTFAFKNLVYLITVVLGGIIESSGFIISILNKLDDQSQKQIIQDLKLVKQNISEKDIEYLANTIKS